MHYIKTAIFLFTLTILVSCKPASTGEVKACFLKDFLDKEVELLSQNNKRLQKAIYYQGEMHDTTITEPLWKEEMELFYVNLPDSQELTTKYKLSPDTSGNRYREQFVKIDKDKSLKTIELIYIDGKIISIRMNEKNIDNLSAQEMSINYNTQKSISSSGNFSLLNGEKKEYEIFGEIK
jgi:hypothetical protein